MKRLSLCAALSAAVLVASGLGCSSKKSPDTEVNGYPAVCRHCNHFFVIPYDKLNTYPAGPNGEGLKCEKCGQFAAMRGTQCKKCKKWYIAESRGMPCPYCTAAKSGQNAAAGGG
jgi:hypothetical protein